MYGIYVPSDEQQKPRTWPWITSNDSLYALFQPLVKLLNLKPITFFMKCENSYPNAFKIFNLEQYN